MIIRSQNKKAIVNMNIIDTIEERDKQIRYFSGGVETEGLLGKYSTEEKAIKVLDMICEHQLQKTESTMSLSQNLECNVKETRNIVFQMPQDEYFD